MNTLVIIPARGGSKGIPHKNIKLLGGKPLIHYAIETARQLTMDENICVSTDDDEIIATVEQTGLKVPFKRPAHLATDTATSYDVIMHAIGFYEEQGKHYDALVLLQPTSPFRDVEDVRACIEKYSPDYEMVVSVKSASANPYYDCFEPDVHGYLQPSKGDGTISRRQDAPKVYEYNGAVYVINIESLKRESYNFFHKIGFVEMSDIHSVDLDTMFDWRIAELMIQDQMVRNESNGLVISLVEGGVKRNNLFVLLALQYNDDVESSNCIAA